MTIWQKISDLGVRQTQPIYEQKSIIILNQLCVIAFPITLMMSFVLGFIYNIPYVSYTLFGNSFLFFVVLYLNYKQKSNFARALVSTIPPISLLISSIYAKTQGYSYSFGFYIAPRTGLLIMCIITLFLYAFRGWKRLFGGMWACLLCFLSFDLAHYFFGINVLKLPHVPTDYFALFLGFNILLMMMVILVILLGNVNKMYELEIEKQQKQVEKLLHNILPEETAQELKNTGQATPKHYKMVSVLFTDFKGFTNIAEKLTPHEVIEELNKCFLVFDEICEKYNLEKIKTIGDAYMCAGGLPVSNNSNPIDAVKAGLEMQNFMEKWKQEQIKNQKPIWELRLGIHTGEVIAGVIGKNKFAYDIWGDTVNLASRMESAGEVGKVNISETTYELIKNDFQCTFRGDIDAKNKGKVKMYFVNDK
jgi:class 3 adenylate cyclase